MWLVEVLGDEEAVDKEEFLVEQTSKAVQQFCGGNSPLGGRIVDPESRRIKEITFNAECHVEEDCEQRKDRGGGLGRMGATSDPASATACEQCGCKGLGEGTC